MSNMESTIASDIEDYERACIFFNKPVTHSHGSPDCYSKEAQALVKALFKAGHGNTSKAALLKLKQTVSP